MNLHRIRWAVRAALLIGITASVVANILHARDNPISQTIAAWPPCALLITVELIARVPVHQRWLAAARLVATATIAGIAAWVSYWHMAGVAARYGETGASPYLLPLSVDGLIVVASICLVELGGRIRAAVESTEGDSRGLGQGREGDAETDVGSDRANDAGERSEGAAGQQEEVAAGSVKLSRPRKPHTTNPERVARAWQNTPEASAADIARRLKLSAATVKRHRPAYVDKVNGREPEFAAAD